MEKNHRQGRPGAGERALRRAHARRLLVTLAGICQHLRWEQTDPDVHAAYREVEQDLLRLMEHRRQDAPARASRRRK